MDLTTNVTPQQAAAYVAYAEIAPWVPMTGAYTPPGQPHDPASAQGVLQHLLAVANSDGTVRVNPGAPEVSSLTSIPFLTKVYYQWKNAAAKWSPAGMSYNTYVPPSFAPVYLGSSGQAADAASAALAVLRTDPASTTAVSKVLTDNLAINLGMPNAGDADHAGANGPLALRQSLINARWLARETGGDDQLSTDLLGDVSQNTALPSVFQPIAQAAQRIGQAVAGAFDSVVSVAGPGAGAGIVSVAGPGDASVSDTGTTGSAWPWVFAGGVAVAAGAVYLLHRATKAEERLPLPARMNALELDPHYRQQYLAGLGPEPATTMVLLRENPRLVMRERAVVPSMDEVLDATAARERRWAAIQAENAWLKARDNRPLRRRR